MKKEKSLHYLNKNLDDFLSPMESESIAMWLDDDGHSVEIIRAALKEAVLARKVKSSLY